MGVAGERGPEALDGRAAPAAAGFVNAEPNPRPIARRAVCAMLTPGPSPAAYLLRMWPVAVVPAALLAEAVSLTARLAGHPLPLAKWPRVGFGWIVIVGPLLETLMMVPILWLLRRLWSSRLPVVVLSAFLWAALHATQSVLQGCSALWGFFVLSCAFVAWRERSLFAAYWMTSSLHGLGNLTAWVLRKSGDGGFVWLVVALVAGLMAGGLLIARALASRVRPSGESATGRLDAGDVRTPTALATDPVPVNLARASWVCPLCGVALAGWLQTYLGRGPSYAIVAFLVAPALGWLAGLAALTGIPRHGRKGILAPALAGLGINGVILLVALVTFLARYTRGGLTTAHP